MVGVGSLESIGTAMVEDAIATVYKTISPAKHNCLCSGAQKLSISGSLAFYSNTSHILCFMPAISGSILKILRAVLEK